MRDIRRMTLVTALLVMQSALLQSGVRAQVSGAVPFFSSHDLIEVTLAANLDAVLNDVGEERSEHPAVLSYRAADGSIQSQRLQVETRGNYRRNPENCSFPPLRINFVKGDVDGTIFAGLDELKMVTHCRTDVPEYDQYVLLEYGLYRVFNLLTPRSFRVRLMRLTYRDVTGRQEPLTRTAFLIEDDDLVAARHGAEAYEDVSISQEQIDGPQRTLLYLFEYMIGNIDWNVAVQQNLDVISPHEDGPFVPLPYDFDLADVIAAPGADRHPPIGPTALRNSLFADYCGTADDLMPAIALFNERKDEIYAIFDETPGLATEHAEATQRYFDRFYRMINSPRFLEREFLRPCRAKE